nr:MAG TPA: Head Tail Connector Protein [Caudoviricetes sp.]
MRYADYTYYVETYGGSMIPERDFQYYAARASEYIDQQTFDRLTKGVPQEFADKVSSCCCEAAEKLYCFSASASGGGAGSDVSSEKIGQYSVTYHSAADTISSMLNGSDAGMSDLLYSIVGRHLGSTGLLYRGVD